MSKLQLLYEKLLKIAFIFSAIFFILFLIDLFSAMVTGAIGSGFTIDDNNTFFKLTLYPLGIGTVIFLVAGRVFYTLAHRESKLLSVSDYKKILLEEEEQEPITREELYTKLRQGKRPALKVEGPLLDRIKDNSKEFFSNVGKFFTELGPKIKEFFTELSPKTKEFIKNFKVKLAEKKELKQVLKDTEQEQKKKDQAIKARTKLNKTELIILISEAADLSTNDSRLFLNTLIDTIRETVVVDEEIKIAKFGRFAKIEVKKTSTIEAYNTVEFTPFKHFLELFISVEQKEPDQGKVITESKTEEPKVEEPKVVEPKVEEPKVVEPKVEEPKVVEPKVEEPKVVEPKVEEPKVVEPKVEEPKVEEPKVVEPKVEEPKVVEPKVEESKVVLPLKEDTPKKPAKPKVVTKTK